MSDNAPTPLRTNKPADAVEIIDQVVGRLRSDGLTVADVAALIGSIQTLRAFVATATTAPASPLAP